MRSEPRLAQHLVLALGLGFVLISWFAGANGGALGFPLDDAWIHMVYGRQWVEDGFLAYNPGVPSTGATSPLWALCLAGLHLVLGAASVEMLVLATYFLNAALHLLTLWASMQLSLACGATRLGACLTGACIATAPLLAVSVFSGMEVTLCAALLSVGHERLLRYRFASAGVFLGLACCARPEAALCLGGALSIIVATRHQSPATDRSSWFTALLHFSLAPVLLGSAVVAYNLWASDRPLPATFYFKQAVSVGELPHRLWVAATQLLTRAAPFAGNLLWLGLLGELVPRILGRRCRPGSEPRDDSVPNAALAGGLLFLVGNSLVIAPSDPSAYYHQRYVLPAVPLLVVGLLRGFERARFGARQWQQRAPVVVFAMFGIAFGCASVKVASRSAHSDIRNINELQRAVGEWLGGHTEDSSWVASVDAGAVRYFSRRPVVDIMGLNTPELYWDAPAYAEGHPVEAIVLMPAWFPTVRAADVRVVHEVRSVPYTVTSNPMMGWQVVLECGAPAADSPRRVGLAGIRRTLLYCPGP